MSHSLPYNTLPPGSSITVSDDGGGTITLSAPARDQAGRGVRRRVAIDAAWTAGVYGAGLLLLLGTVSYGVVRANWNYIPWAWAAPVASVFVLALFALLWQSVYRRKLDTAIGPMSQATVLAVRPQRLLVETTGPLGNESHDLMRTQVKDIKLLLDLRAEE